MQMKQAITQGEMMAVVTDNMSHFPCQSLPLTKNVLLGPKLPIRCQINPHRAFPCKSEPP